MQLGSHIAGNIRSVSAGTSSDDRLAGDSPLNSSHLSGAPELDDLLYGRAGNDRLLGWAGDDELYGGAGNDRLEGHLGRDLLTGGADDDRLYGGNGNDRLVGDAATDAGDDVLRGGIGNDVLRGGAGNDNVGGDEGADTLYGGAGRDRFYFRSVADSAPASGIDTIQDFSTTQGDRIDLRTIDASTDVAGDQAFTWIGRDGSPILPASCGSAPAGSKVTSMATGRPIC